jgi:hypothetical protein
MNSHYVPQFILKNFCNNNENLIYCDFDSKTTSVRNTRSVFAEQDYYPDQLEKDLCHKIEHAFANLYHNKLENAKNSIDLTEDELFTLQKYLIVSTVRYKYEYTEFDKAYIASLPKVRRSYIKIDSIDSLNKILKFNNSAELMDYLNEVREKYHINNQNGLKADEDYNAQFLLDTHDIMSNFLVFVRPQDREEFIMPDIGHCDFFSKQAFIKYYFAEGLMLASVAEKSFNPILMQLPLMISPRDYMVYPLTKNLTVISMSAFFWVMSNLYKGVEGMKADEISRSLGFSDNRILNSHWTKSNGTYHNKIERISTHDVCHLNCAAINQSKRFIACSDLSKIQQSVQFAKRKINKDISFLEIK